MWGPQCDKPCSCGNNSSCDPKSGGTSGFFCPSTHPCQNGGVFQTPQGSCSCPPGWMGTICSLPCPEGFHGPNCSQECRCHNGGLCDRFTGQCRCAPGYTGDRCREECPVGRFGQDCAETCDCAPDARCFPANGACLCEHGFTGDRCTDRLCPDGFYGLSCQAPCTCDREHSLSCHPMNGECSCLPGWAGLHCNESCPQDTHGPGCQEHCLCLHGGVCQATSGLCQCAPGYTGPHCASLCPPPRRPRRFLPQAAGETGPQGRLHILNAGIPQDIPWPPGPRSQAPGLSCGQAPPGLCNVTTSVSPPSPGCGPAAGWNSQPQ
uniref:cDNA FLJ25943 fis, clone JTH10559 n=1 Tax=Homo sapiens TaxID=9606 RepID=Q8N780_HUMAN|nr:unnamed protein product [Homo sapiens]